MAATIADRVFDNGLTVLDTEANKLTICSQVPTTYTEANATYALGSKTSISVGAPADGAVSGRRVTIAAITDGSVTATGTATHYALIDTSNSRLLVTNTLASSQAVTNGNVFTTAAFDVTFADPV